MLHGLHISEHAYRRHGTRALHQPRRTRKLLLHRSEIDKIVGRLGDAASRSSRCRCTSGRLGEGGDRPGARRAVL